MASMCSLCRKHEKSSMHLCVFIVILQVTFVLDYFHS